MKKISFMLSVVCVLSWLSALPAQAEVQYNPNKTAKLLLAVKEGRDADAINYIKQKDVDVNARYEGVPVLITAADKGRLAVVKALLNRSDIDVNKKAEGSGQTALYYASSDGHVAIVKELLKKPGIDVNNRASLGETALWMATHNNHVEVVKALLAHPDIDVNIPDDSEDHVTPLMEAARKGYVEIAKALLNHKGIKLDARCFYGHTALYYAQITHNDEIADLIQLRQKSTVQEFTQHLKKYVDHKLKQQS